MRDQAELEYQGVREELQRGGKYRCGSLQCKLLQIMPPPSTLQ